MLGRARDQCVQGRKLRGRHRQLRCPHVRIRTAVEQGVELRGQCRPLGLHPQRVLRHPGDLDLRPQHVALASVAHAVHRFGGAADVVEQTQRLTHHAECAVRLVEPMEESGCTRPYLPPGVIGARALGLRPRVGDVPGESELARDGDHLHHLQLRHPQRRHRREGGEHVVHPPELELRIRGHARGRDAGARGARAGIGGHERRTRTPHLCVERVDRERRVGGRGRGGRLRRQQRRGE